MNTLQLLCRFSLAFFFVVLFSVISPAFSQSTPPTGRIVGGNDAQPGAWPFMVAILARGNSAPAFRQFCGGSLIHPRWVLTAAHCLEGESPSGVSVGVGLHDLRVANGQEINAVRLIIHPSYNSNTSDNDIALIELAQNATLGTPIQIVSNAVNLTGMTSTAIGWGATSEGGSSSPILQQVDLPVVSNATCNASYGGITANMVCAGFAEGGKDSCQGDSGGPLVVGSGSSLRLAGVTSFGVGCARPFFYGVYARPANYTSWIAQYITTASETNGPYGLWNGFINLVNVIELQNSGGSDVNAQINMFDINGTLISSTIVAVGAGRQQDVILNSLPGFSLNSYGIVQVSNNVSGRIFYYRPRNGVGFENFDFAFGIPLSDGMSGAQRVSFNTYQPSSNPADQGNLVANWFSVVNLDSVARGFQVFKYSEAGQLLSSTSFTLGARQRVDLDGGHVNPGPRNVGFLEVIPTDGSTNFLAQLIRYGYATGGSSFDFAFPLIPTPGASASVVVPLGSRFSAQNWLEIVNSSALPQAVAVAVYDENSTLRFSDSVPLEARSQAHLFINNVLTEGQLGYAVLTPAASRTVIAQSMFYFRNPSNGSITSMYGSQSRFASAANTSGTFNLFLGMENYLKVSNTSNSTANVQFQVQSVFSGGSSFSRQIAPRSTIELNLHDFATFGTVANSYGTVRIIPNGATIVPEIIRVKRETNGLLQFSAPTEFQ